jgi:hypothetical protein
MQSQFIVQLFCHLLETIIRKVSLPLQFQLSLASSLDFFIPLCTNRGCSNVCIIYSVAMLVRVSSCKVWRGKSWKPLFCINNAGKLSFQSEAGMSNRNNST